MKIQAKSRCLGEESVASAAASAAGRNLAAAILGASVGEKELSQKLESQTVSLDKNDLVRVRQALDRNLDAFVSEL
jgi:hypothetical protein